MSPYVKFTNITYRPLQHVPWNATWNIKCIWHLNERWFMTIHKWDTFFIILCIHISQYLALFIPVNTSVIFRKSLNSSYCLLSLYVRQFDYLAVSLTLFPGWQYLCICLSNYISNFLSKCLSNSLNVYLSIRLTVSLQIFT